MFPKFIAWWCFDFTGIQFLTSWGVSNFPRNLETRYKNIALHSGYCRKTYTSLFCRSHVNDVTCHVGRTALEGMALSVASDLHRQRLPHPFPRVPKQGLGFPDVFSRSLYCRPTQCLMPWLDSRSLRCGGLVMARAGCSPQLSPRRTHTEQHRARSS